MTQVVEYLPSKCKTLNSNHSTAKKFKNPKVDNVAIIPLPFQDKENILL
jgi:hypothetical protein